MRDNIYILVSFGGSYEDAWETVKKASFDKAKLEGEAHEKNAELDRKREIQKEYNAFRDDWEKKNPQPEIPEIVYEEMPVPKLPNREKDITPEMRAEKNWIRSENSRRHREVAEIAHRPYNKWVKEVREPAIAKWYADRGLNPDALKEYIGSENERGYRVDEVPFEE